MCRSRAKREKGWRREKEGEKGGRTHLSETLVGLPWELLGSPSSGNSLETVSLGDTNDVDDLILLCEAKRKERGRGTCQRRRRREEERKREGETNRRQT